MSASKPTTAERMAALEAQIALLAQAVTTLTTKPVSGASAASATRSADGRDFACTAALPIGADGKPVTVPCSRMLRSAARAAIHGVEAGGHEYRAS